MEERRNRFVITVESALSVALSVVLSGIILFRMPQGGEISLELVPLMILAFRHGVKPGLIAGALVGVLKLLLGGYFLHPMQALLDYPMAFACVGMVAVRPRFLGFTLASCLHIFCSILSGVFFFASFAPKDMNPWVYSFLYNVPVLGVKYILSFIAAQILWKSLNKQMKSP